MPETLLKILKEEKEINLSGGIYHKVQVEFTYNSNCIEGNRLTKDQVRFIYDTNSLGPEDGIIKVDDLIETANHFRCIDMVIDCANFQLSESFIKKLHCILENGTTDSRKSWFQVGSYKKVPNEVGGMETAKPEEVDKKIKSLLSDYNKKKNKTLKDLIEFHYKFERIHPFQDGNGRIGRLIFLRNA